MFLLWARGRGPLDSSCGLHLCPCGPLPSPSKVAIVGEILLMSSLWPSLLLPSSTFKDFCDYIRSTRIIQDNRPHFLVSRLATTMPSAALFPFIMSFNIVGFQELGLVYLWGGGCYSVYYRIQIYSPIFALMDSIDPMNSRDGMRGCCSWCWKVCWTTALPYHSSFSLSGQCLFPYQGLPHKHQFLHMGEKLNKSRSLLTWASPVDNSYLPTVIWMYFECSEY